MRIEKYTKNAFVVIGKEGSTLEGQGFIQKLWSDANSHFSEVQPLAKKTKMAIWLVFGAQCPIFPVYTNRGKITSAKGYTLPALNVLMMPKRPRDGQNGQFRAMNPFTLRLKMIIHFRRY